MLIHASGMLKYASNMLMVPKC